MTTLSYTFISSVLEASKDIMIHNIIENVYGADDKDSKMLAEEIHRMYKFPLLKSYNDATPKTLVVKAHVRSNPKLEYPGVKHYGLIVDYGISCSGGIKGFKGDTISFIWEDV